MIIITKSPPPIFAMVHLAPIPHCVFLNLSNPFLKALRLVAPTVCWSSMFHLLTTLLKKKYIQQSQVHLILLNFSV